MKISIILFTFLISISLFANNTDSRVEIKSEKAKCSINNYKLCLKHENAGVVESALANIIKFKYHCPNENYKCIIKQLNVLLKNHENNNISKKAALVLKILQNQDLIAEIGNKFYANLDQFLDAIILSSKYEQELTLNNTIKI